MPYRGTMDFMKFAPRRPSPMNGIKPSKKDLAPFRLAPVDDILPAEDETTPLRMLIVGVNPSPWTAAVNAPFAHPANRFWPSLYKSGIISQLVDASAGLPDSVLEEFAAKRIGLTNFISGMATARADELTKEQLRIGAQRIVELANALHPESVAVAGITAYRDAFGLRKAKLGWQNPAEVKLPEGWPVDVQLWVVPQPSGINAHENIESLGQKWAAVWQATEPTA